MKIEKNKLVGFEQIVEMLKAKTNNNKSKNIYFSEKDINKYLSFTSLEILSRLDVISEDFNVAQK
jgi:BMFP domain-containing protein YqiC|tara:strand:+ start:304 stop:498 length:195 start_codon:yes stop_codon:yes gene_type:complete